MQKLSWMLIAAALAVGPVFAQQAQQAYPVELSMPFGIANGNLVAAGDYLIFVDSAAVEKSFVIPRDNIQNARFDNPVVTIELRRPIGAESGERARLSFRPANAGDANSIVQWSMESTAERSANPPSTTPVGEIPNQQFSYEVKHDHLVGSGTGRLIATSDRLIFESVTNVNHSRQWSMNDIKEVEHKNPYKLQVQPFTGDGYNFEFIGRGMDSADFAHLTALIAAARARR